MHYLSTAWITTTFEGWHAWPAAPEGCAYLRARHRHLFHVKAGLSVAHNDRDIEFHDLLHFVRGCLPGPELGGQSCEMIAEGIASQLQERWPHRAGYVEVSEDSEVGATVVFGEQST